MLTVRELIVLIKQLKALAGVSMYGAFRDGYVGALDVIKAYLDKRGEHAKA